MRNDKKANVALVATGEGTDGRAIMQIGERGCIPNSNINLLISTKYGAGCLDKADDAGVENCVIARSDYNSLDSFNKAFAEKIKAENIHIVFLVGCLVKIYPIDDVTIYNIHPCDIHKHGGYGMYNLKTHEHVLLDIKDQINRGRKTINDQFLTYPTVHEAVLEYDAGVPLMTSSVEIPQWIIEDWFSGKLNLHEAAEQLQQIVLPYEWIMLPCAVQMAAQKILKVKTKDFYKEG